jgi:hydroxymethylglutaryl-CoA lyase
MGAADGRQRRGSGGIARAPGVRYAALTPNMKGYERARAARADEVAIFGSASEGFSRANINATIEESLARFAPVVEAARADGMPVRGYVSCVVECPYDGPVAPAAVARVAARLRAMGCYEISLGDTIGRGTPEAVDGHARRRAGRGSRPETSRGISTTRPAVRSTISRWRWAGACGSSMLPWGDWAAAPMPRARRATWRRRRWPRGSAALGYETGLDAEVIAQAARMARAMRGGGDG